MFIFDWFYGVLGYLGASSLTRVHGVTPQRTRKICAARSIDQSIFGDTWQFVVVA